MQTLRIVQVARLCLLPFLAGLMPQGAPAQAPATEHPQAGTSGFLVDAPPLFRPLHADPRWPHFGAAYQHHWGEGDLSHVAAVSLGETLSLYRDASEAIQWDLSLQAGVFAIFDLESVSNDLVNADYRFGPAVALRRDGLAAQVRLYHQSSHLGDEFVLRRSIQRVNLSYEVADVLLSFDVAEAVRLYGGGGRILHSEPDLEPWVTQAGLELHGRRGETGFRPVAAFDLQARDEHDWHVDLSVRVGIEQDQEVPGDRRLQLLLEYYLGRSPNGQFYVDDVQWLGIAVNFRF
jgi:hypothetical protein